MKYAVERTLSDLNHTCLGATYRFYYDILKDLIYAMRDKIDHPFIKEEYRNLRFVMNIPLYHVFFITCQATCHDSDMYRGIKIVPDSSLYIGNTQSPVGIVRLVYEEPEVKHNLYCASDAKATYEFFTTQTKPHIDHVKFNGPATIVFWKDGTKTVVKHDGKGRKDKRLAVLYAFMRKIYGEGKPYHDILNEIERAVK